MAEPILVFDLDGTLVETMGDLTASLNVTLVNAGYQPIEPERVRTMVGHGARALLQRGLEANDAVVDDDALTALYNALIDYYSRNIAVHSHPFPGVLAALEALRAAGWRAAVCTNKVESLARSLLEALDMAHLFEAIVGGDTFERSKPDAMPVLGAIERAGGDPARAVMIGDSRTDIDAARAAGIPVIAVTFGYTPVPVTELSPDVVISDFLDLPCAVESLKILEATA